MTPTNPNEAVFLLACIALAVSVASFVLAVVL